MKKIGALAIICVLVMLLAACRNSDNDNGENNITDDNYTIITFGGIWVSHEARRAVRDFNLENEDFQIEILCYDTLFGSDAAVTRFNLDMIAGQGPDIICGFNNETLEDTEFLADLYSFIDSDPTLNRTDFLPNILTAMENRSGKLQLVSNYFTISPYYAMPETVSEVGLLTYENIIRWLRESDSHSFGDEWMHRYWFVLESVLSFSDYFIDWENNIANLDSKAFIYLLNIAQTMPEPEQFGFRNELEDLRNGNQLFTMEQVVNVDSLRGGLRHDVLSDAGLSGMVPVGVPSTTFGQHEFFRGHSLILGINAGSSHQEAAWSFVRSTLVPDGFVSEIGLPLRIDVLESLIAESMTPYIVDGEEMKQPTGPFGDMMYAMTEEEAAELWDIIDNTSLRPRKNEAIRDIILEGLQQFFSGNATAEDAARVMQSRVQTFLWERN